MQVQITINKCDQIEPNIMVSKFFETKVLVYVYFIGKEDPLEYVSLITRLPKLKVFNLALSESEFALDIHGYLSGS